ncbi:hypothetical protein FQN55_000715 [Onygenales sp. PD_40]|nr:hypothetical protein FQN55_000715 [Onygenales sp. PD_40]
MPPPPQSKSSFISPFASSTSTIPGHGKVVLSLLPPSIPSLTTLSYKYPLKLLTRTPITALNSKYPDSATTPVHLYLLTYGGGLLPGDDIQVSITLNPRTRLVVTTPQGSTKIYKTEPRGMGRGTTLPSNINNITTPSPSKSRQTLDIRISPQAGLCYLPDPSQPFESSQYEQIQTFTLLSDGAVDHPNNQPPSLCVLDWVTQGRTARGEDWSFHSWKGRNEVWSEDPSTGKRRLLLRENVILEDEEHLDHDQQQQTSSPAVAATGTPPRKKHPLSIRARTRPHGILGTLILHGPLFESLSTFMMQEFTSQPRIGGRNWSAGPAPASSTVTTAASSKNVTWTAARVRGDFVLVKFGARDFEAAKEWLGELMRREGGVVGEFGEEALGCL